MLLSFPRKTTGKWIIPKKIPSVFDKRLCEDAPVLIDISGMKGYEIVQEFSLRCPFFNQRGKEEWKWSQSPHKPRFSKTTEVGVLYFGGRQGERIGMPTPILYWQSRNHD